MTECFLKLWLGSAETLVGLLCRLAVTAVELQREQARAALSAVFEATAVRAIIVTTGMTPLYACMRVLQGLMSFAEAFGKSRGKLGSS